jgi:hypothetical protein
MRNEHTSCNRKYYVGKLTTNELPTFPEPTAFHRTIKSRVENHFKSKGKDPKVLHATDGMIMTVG